MHHILCDARTEWASPDIGASTLSAVIMILVSNFVLGQECKKKWEPKKYSYYHILCDAQLDIGANPPVIIIISVSNFALGQEWKNTRRGVFNWGEDPPTKYSYNLILCDVRTEWCSPILVLTNSQQSSSFWRQILVQMEGWGRGNGWELTKVVQMLKGISEQHCIELFGVWKLRYL